jgi:hypothetical protein
LVLIAIVAAVANWLQQQEQNRIFREQNRIFAESGGRAVPPEKPRHVWVKRYWPTLITVLVFLLIGYDIYDHRAHGSSASSSGSISWPGLMLLLIAVGLGLMIGRVKRGALSENVDDVLAGLPRQTPAPKEPPKLLIHSADYRAWNGSGEHFDVTEFLRKIIVGDCLVHGPVENGSFMIDGKNYVPRDPLSGQVKRLQVTYSYNGEASRTIQRSEHGRLVLPEDSAISWLEKQVEVLKAAQPKPSQYPVPELRGKIVAIISELQGFLGEHGQEPRDHDHLGGESAEEWAKRDQAEVRPWQAKFLGDYRLRFGNKISDLQDEMRSRAHIDDHDLDVHIRMASVSSRNCFISVNEIVKKLGELAFKVNT